MKSFRDRESELIANGIKSKRTLKLLPSELHYVAYKKLIYLDNIKSIESLKAWAGLKLELLKGDRKGQLSIRINDQYRICFWFKEGQAYDVEIVDYH
ncbi:MAG: type II toxin-antitoxin system RelE/ParE family toxin [Proteobacteria bacterium]|nr:type II toxin-antitoxin system RelE/ParE family toxin [Pseudomonadota bacterium]